MAIDWATFRMDIIAEDLYAFAKENGDEKYKELVQMLNAIQVKKETIERRDSIVILATDPWHDTAKNAIEEFAKREAFVEKFGKDLDIFGSEFGQYARSFARQALKEK